MKPVFVDSQELEKLAKEAFLFPPFLMMENAAAAMEAAVMKAVYQSDSAVNARPFKALVLCGSGNNGGDGYALAFVAEMVQTVPMKHFYLISAVAVVFSPDTVPRVPFFVDLYFRHSAFNRVG